jgi:hypothetical protein
MRFQPSEHSFGESRLPAPRSGDSPPQSGVGGGAWALGAAGLVGLAVVPTLVIYPFVIKAFKPELSYWRRVGIGMGITFALGAVTGLVRAAKK